MAAEIRATGLEALPEVPGGAHLCQFYRTADDLLSVVLPFIRAGLERKEYCLWIAWEPVGTSRVLEALANDLPDPAVLFGSSQIEVASHCAPEFKRGLFEMGGFVDSVNKRIDKAIAMGYRGVRITENLSWHHEIDWSSLIEGERSGAGAMAQRPVIALCSYPVDTCTGFQMKDVGSAHHYVLISVGGQCEVIDGGQRREQEGKSCQYAETSYREVFENMLDGMVLLDTETSQVLLANNMAARILGFDSAEELLGLNAFCSFRRRNGQKVTPATLRGLMHSEHQRVREITGINRDGRDISLISTGVRTECQGRQAELITVRDMTGIQKPQRIVHTSQHYERQPDKLHV